MDNFIGLITNLEKCTRYDINNISGCILEEKTRQVAVGDCVIIFINHYESGKPFNSEARELILLKRNDNDGQLSEILKCKMDARSTSNFKLSLKNSIKNWYSDAK